MAEVKKNQIDEQFKQYLELFKLIHINIPFVEALSQMPKYAKYFEELWSDIGKLEKVSKATLDEECLIIS